ncbi:hypothetical protein Tco_0938087 [Tanacetum coccineum]|uniref:Uncharacterized protein n=1 Tax=Tanacetum coccineum TaxID=301880 RepID=A0ABQ5DIR4_9ASTR
MLAIQAVEVKGSGQPSEPQPIPSPAPPSHKVQVTNVASHPQKTHTPRRAKRGWDTEIPQSSSSPKKVSDEVVYIGEDDRVVRAATTATSLEAEQESVNTSRSGEDSMEHQNDLTDFIPTTPHDLPLSGGHTPGSDKGRPNINDLMAICTKLSNRVLAMETSKTAQDLVIKKLKKKIKRLEKKLRARTSGMKLFKIGISRRKSLDKENVSKQGRNLKTRPMFEEGDFDDDFDDINDMVNEAMENVEGDTVNVGGAVNTTTTGVSASNASVTTIGVSISTAEQRTPPTTTTTAFEDEDLTIAQTLVKIRSQKDKEKGKGVAFRSAQEESSRPTIILPTARLTRILPTIDLKAKGKGIMQEPEKPPKYPRKAQIQMDEELAIRLHEEEKVALERMQRDRAAQEASTAALTIEFDDVQARMDADALLAARLPEEEREQFFIDEQARFLVEIITEKKRFTYNQLKNKSLEEIQKLYEKEHKWINDFVPMDFEMVKDSGKKDDDSQKQAESRDDIVINVESLATKYPIFDWKTHILTENMMYYQIIIADGSSNNYKIFSKMLDDFDRQDVVDLYRLGEGSTVLVESHHTPTSATSTSQPPLSSPSRIPTRKESKVPQPKSPTQTPAADEAASTGVDVRHGGAVTTISSIDAGQGSSNIDKTPTMPHDSSLPRVHTLRSDEGRMQHNELMDLVTKLLDRVVALEIDLRQTKKVYGATYTKLIKKVKKLERAAKLSQSRRRANIVVSNDEDDAEDSSK